MVPVYSLGINDAQKTLIAGTYARSILSFPIDSLKLGENSGTFTPNGGAAPTLSISPNPASVAAVLKIENLKSSQVAAVNIVNVSGKTMFTKQFLGFGKHEEEISLQDFAPGVYFAFVRTAGKVWGTRKFEVTR